MLENNFGPLLSFLVFFCSGLAYFIAFTFVYLRITPYAEIKLIREGNTAAAVGLAGALIGYALPLARAIEQSESSMDLLIWATVALVIQTVVFLVLHRMMPELSRRVKEDRMSEALLLAAISIGVGLINAASMTA